MGNPPFVGMKYQSSIQKEDIQRVNPELKGLDYVTCWFYKSFEFTKGTPVKTALVSTNSICQGEQVAKFWRPLIEDGLEIIFAYRSFIWENISTTKGIAHVHCVIIGFQNFPSRNKFIYDTDGVKKVKNINAYLVDAEDMFIDSVNTSLFPVHKMIAPNKPCDYNHLKVEPDEYKEMIEKCPRSAKYLKRMVGAQEFIKNKERWCLWLVNCPPAELKKMPPVMDRVSQCKKARIEANTSESLRLAKTPTLFREQLNPDNYLIIPCVSSENRTYIPMGLLNGDYIPVMGTLIIPDATKYELGVLTSSVHMAWMRTVAGRLEMRYRYSKDIVYNNFPWPNLTDKQKQQIEETAQAILNARAAHPESSLADLYDPLTMPEDLRKAHENNDKVVKRAYGFKPSMSEPEIVAELFRLYDERVKELEKEAKEAKETAKAEKAATSKRRKR